MRVAAALLIAIAALGQQRQVSVLQVSAPGCGACTQLGATIQRLKGEYGAQLRSSTRVVEDPVELEALGAAAPPVLFVNGRRYAGPFEEAELRQLLDNALGRPALGKPVALDLSSAPRLGTAGLPEITVFSDFECPYCVRLAPVLKDLAETGAATIRFKHYPLPFHRNAPVAHRATIAAGEQGRFWEMHDRIFASGAGQLTRAAMDGHAKELGLDMAKFAAAMDTAQPPAVLSADMLEAERAGVQGTPTVFVNGRQLLSGASPEGIRAALALTSEKPVQAATPARELRLYGEESAPVRVEWFFDAQSELTKAAAADLIAFLGASPAETTVVARHRPLEFHPESPLVHEALSLAADEGKFFEFLQMFQREISSAGPDRLKSLAMRLGMDSARFSKALDARERRTEVERDLEVARERGVRGVPQLFVNGERVASLPQGPAARGESGRN